MEITKKGFSAALEEAVKTFYIVTVDGSEVPEALHAIAAQAQPYVQFRVVDTLSKGLEMAGTAPVLVLHMPPETHILRALRAGVSPDDALVQWRTVIGSYLDQARKVRRQIISLDSRTLAAEPDRCAEILASGMGFHLGKSVDSHPVRLVEEMPAILALATNALMQNDPRALGLAGELEAMNAASALMPVDGYSLEPVFTELLKLEAELKVVETTRLGLEQMQARLEREVQARCQQVAASEGLQAKLLKLEVERHQLRADLEQMQDRLEREVQARCQQAEISEGLQVKLLEAEAERKQLRADLEQAQVERYKVCEELAIIYRSNSWRATGPLRWLRRNLTSG